MNSNQNFSFNLSSEIAECDQQVKAPQKSKHKFMKDLNHKLNFQVKSFKQQNSTQKFKRKASLQKKQLFSDENSQISCLMRNLVNGINLFRGELKDNKMEGHVFIEYSDGCSFDGIFENDLKVYGKMTYGKANCVYEGAFCGQKFSGFGTLSYEGGRTIKGQWDHTQIVGNATITYPNGDLYYGPVDENLYKHGEGHLFFNNGFKYVGMFQNGSLTGFGSYYKGDELIKVGLWNKGELVKEILNEDMNIMGTQYYKNNFSQQISKISKAKVAKINEQKQSHNREQNVKMAQQTDEVEESQITEATFRPRRL